MAKPKSPKNSQKNNLPLEPISEELEIATEDVLQGMLTTLSQDAFTPKEKEFLREEIYKHLNDSTLSLAENKKELINVIRDFSEENIRDAFFKPPTKFWEEDPDSDLESHSEENLRNMSRNNTEKNTKKNTIEDKIQKISKLLGELALETGTHFDLNIRSPSPLTHAQGRNKNDEGTDTDERAAKRIKTADYSPESESKHSKDSRKKRKRDK